MRLSLLLLLIIGLSACNNQSTNEQSKDQDWSTPFEANTNTTPTYPEVIDYYERLAGAYSEISLVPWGQTDAGHPLHTAIFSADGTFDPQNIRDNDSRILFINNAIHPGEPCGVDATMMLYRDLAQHDDVKELIGNTVIVAVPMYNIGGALNRNSHSRTNQMGPEAYGFRGNAKNLDLNRDFIKADSKNAETFNQIFSHWSPDVFVDNHTSNGADYQYVMTLISSQKDKLNPILSEYMYGSFVPELYKDMESRGYEMTPYVNVRRTPDGGIYDFLDLPRYSSGYATLHNAIGFTSEAHMLKPYELRVKGTYQLMNALLKMLKEDSAKIKEVRQQAIEYTQNKQKEFALNWSLDREKSTPITFKGYEAKYKKSEVSGQERLYYDHDSPWEKEIPFYNTYNATATVDKPIAYIIPQAYSDVIDRLKWNGIKMSRLASDQVVSADFYYIKDFSSRTHYEGHYLHYGVELESVPLDWQYHKGDYVIYVNQPLNRYIVETLEPQGADSYFAWNFFDGILGQKEYFSSYVFEDLAAQYLEEKPELREKLEAKKKEDPEFAKSGYQQLNFVYELTPHYEKTHMLYPVGRIVNSNISLDTASE